MSPQIFGLVSSRDRSLRCFLIACSLVVAIISMLTSITVLAAPVWSGVVASKQTIDRTHKGDRLSLVLKSDASSTDRPIRVNVLHRAVQYNLPDGCEALASHLARSKAAHIAGRCES
jgi:hypothetical protein